MGIPNLTYQSIALRMRWLWQDDTDCSKQCHGLPTPIDNIARAAFRASTSIQIHSGKETKFWKSNWLNPTPLYLLYPNVYKHSRMKNCSVRQAIPNRSWISCIKPRPTRLVLQEYLQLWQMLDQHGQIHFDEEPDVVRWKWTSSGQYTAASAYHFLFSANVRSSVLADLWAIKAILKCKIHAWIILQNKALTDDNLDKRGLPHPPLSSLQCPA